MSVIFIGDRSVGKSYLAKRLASPQSQRVKITNVTEAQLESDPSFYGSGEVLPTQNIAKRPLEIQVRLTASIMVQVDWVDTPGEIWRPQWQQAQPDQWNQLKSYASESKGIVVVLPPYRNLGKGITDPDLINLHEIPNQVQWCKRFNRWVKFFLQYCPKAQHIVLCINKADLFCSDLEGEARKVAYNPGRGGMDWVDRNHYTINKYFAPVKDSITQINAGASGRVVRCFITTIHNRSLLELPWLYLGCFL
jgi:hypothetical protein